MAIDPMTSFTDFLLAAGVLGTAAFGLVDVFKPVISYTVMNKLEARLGPFLGKKPLIDRSMLQPPPGIDCMNIIRANWRGGMTKADQKAEAKALIRLILTHLPASTTSSTSSDGTGATSSTPTNAKHLAQFLGLADLETAASRISQNPQAEDQDLNRFDAIVARIVNGAYEDAEEA